MARISADAGDTLQGQARAEPVLAARLHGIQMGHGDRLSAFFDGRAIARGLPRGGAQSVLPQGAKGYLICIPIAQPSLTRPYLTEPPLDGAGPPHHHPASGLRLPMRPARRARTVSIY